MRNYKKRIKISISKYNPLFRNEMGIYTKDEWTSISDIGKIYNEKEFSFYEYQKVEDKYIESIFLILNYFEVNKIKIEHIFKFDKKKDFLKHDSIKLFPTYQKIERGTIINEKNIIADLIRLKLREHIAELELLIEAKSRTEISLGFDFYMYLKTNKEVSLLLEQIKEIGLFTN